MRRADGQMRVAATALLLCIGGVLCGERAELKAAGGAGLVAAGGAGLVAAAGAGGAASLRARRSSVNERWLNILTDYARDVSEHGGSGRDAAASALRPFTVDLPVGGRDGRRAETLPVLVLPLPVPVSSSRRECDASDEYDDDYEDERPRPPKRRPTSNRRPRPQQPRRRPADDPPRARSDDLLRSRPEPVPVLDRPSKPVTSQQLVEHFRAQTPDAPHLPPAVFRIPREVDFDVRFGARTYLPPRGYRQANQYLPPPAPPAPPAPPSNRYLPPDTRSQSPDEPPRPRFTRSLLMRAELSVPRSDYTEQYTARWDATTGSSRIDYHESGVTTFRSAQTDGSMQWVELRADRTGPQPVMRCAVARSRGDSPLDRAPPAVPDLDLFTFAGYTEEGERWRHVVSGSAGALGAARGETLSYQHEMLLRRTPDGGALPVRYTVNVDSSVLGAGCDRYEHRYLQVLQQEQSPDTFTFDMDRVCEEREQLDTSNAEHMARVEPLREFTMLRRDPRHDLGLESFISTFERNYVDDTELAVRKNLFVQHSRFVSSCNRQGATFEVEVNFLGDRLDTELDVLLGVAFDDTPNLGGSFPHSDSETRQLKEGLAKEFDWRPLGAVTEVYYQGSCASCWAFAVTGSVEGALFVATRRLVPLSQQCLVDCAHSHGAHGCNGTWPNFAYDYIRDRGQPARDEYTAYKEKVLQCQDRRVPPVTHISAYINVPPNNIDALKVAIKEHAPSVVIVDARPKSFSFYKKGVLEDERCQKAPAKKLNHAVLAVGWGEMNGAPHFILKNTYSAKWGDGGYIRLHAPTNTCGVLTLPSYAQVRPSDVDRGAGGGGGGGGGGVGDGGNDLK